MKNVLRVGVGDLQVGMYVSNLDRPWLETPFLFQGFTIRDQDDIDELSRHCKYVHVDVSQTEAAVDVRALARIAAQADAGPDRAMTLPARPREKPAAAKPRTIGRQGGKEQRVYGDIPTLRRELSQTRDQHDRASSMIREVMDGLASGGKLDVRTAKRAVEPIVESVMKNTSAMAWLARMRESSDYLYTHSVSSAIWATVMACHIGMPKEVIEAVGLGAMLLDIGKTRVPQEILAKPVPLTDEETVIARRHVEQGIELLEESGGISRQVLEMVQTHHERHDGSGYPHGLSGQQIPVLGRIAGIVDYYDAITSNRPYAAAQSSYDCLRTLNRLAGTAFQSEMVEQFIQSIGFFPPGSLVQLSDGSVAVVVAQNRRHRLKPEILLILDPQRDLLREFQLVDLQMEVRSDYSGEVLHIDKGLEAGSFGIDPAEYFLA